MLELLDLGGKRKGERRESNLSVRGLGGEGAFSLNRKTRFSCYRKARGLVPKL